MFVHISPEPDAVSETISTLKFAERVATVELGAAKVNKDSTDVKELKEQVCIPPNSVILIIVFHYQFVISGTLKFVLDCQS